MESWRNTLEDIGPTRNCHPGFHSPGTLYAPMYRTPMITAEATSFQSRFGLGGRIQHQPDPFVEGPGFVNFRPSRISRGRETCFCPDCLHRSRSLASESVYARTNDLNARTPTFPDQLQPTHGSIVHGPTSHTQAFASNRSYHAGMQPDRPMGFPATQQHFVNFDHSSSPCTHRMGSADKEYVTVPQPMFVQPGIGPTNPADKLGYLQPTDEEPLDLSASGSSASVAFFNNSQKCGRSIGTEPLAKRIRLSQTPPARNDTGRCVSSQDVQRTYLSTCIESPKLPSFSQEPLCGRLEFHQECAAPPINDLTQMSGPKPQLFANPLVGFSPASTQHVSGLRENVTDSAHLSYVEGSTPLVTAAEENRQAVFIRSSEYRNEGTVRTVPLDAVSSDLQPRVSTASPSVNLQHDHPVLINDSHHHGTTTSSTNAAQDDQASRYVIRENTREHAVFIPLGNVIVPVHGIQAFRIAERPLVVQCKGALAPQEERNVESVRRYLTRDKGVETHYRAKPGLHHHVAPFSIERPSSSGPQVCQYPFKRMAESSTKSKENENQIARDETACQPPQSQHRSENPLATSSDACISSSLPILVSLLTGQGGSSSTQPSVSSPASPPPNVSVPHFSTEPRLKQSNADDTKPHRSSVTMNVGMNGTGLSGNQPKQSNKKCGPDENVELSDAQLPPNCPNIESLQRKSPEPMASPEQLGSPEVRGNQKNEKDGCTWIDQAIEGVVLGALFDRPFSELFDFWMDCQPVFLVTK
ncbi:Hypp1356 [Branchiostoma lanceolatum]|uniref:Hypp1356 protein n=1 Tax=Branchiostoma lanceolatum TaxID=7740 RepID=A0A8J9ZJM1_BRALA|nr:Hypp1356 [Branchiostoma lanceolatum]